MENILKILEDKKKETEKLEEQYLSREKEIQILKDKNKEDKNRIKSNKSVIDNFEKALDKVKEM